MPINQHANISITLASGATAQANFGSQILMADHAVSSDVLMGPYADLPALVDAGFTAADEPVINAWATTVFAQRPRVQQVYVGLWPTGDTLVEALDAVAAEDPAAAYAFNIESRTTPNIMALATWIEPRSKIAQCQSDDSSMLAGDASTAQTSTITVGGTPTDGVYSAALVNDWTGATIGTATITRTAGSPSSNDNIATALAAQLEANTAIAAITSPIASSTNTIPVTFAGLGNHYSWVLTAPSPGTLAAADSPGQVMNPGELLEAGGFTRTGLWYHDDDTEYLDGAITARCLGFQLDAPSGAGTWSYHRLAGISATRLTDSQKAELTDVNCNWYAPVRYTSGVEEAGFTFRGVMGSGRFIDVTTTIDLTQARLEEATMGVFFLAASANRKVPYDDKGIALFETAHSGVFEDLVIAGHYAKNAVSPVTGDITPKVTYPLVANVSASAKAARRLTGSAEAVFAGAINSLGDTLTVGLAVTLNLS